MIATELKLLRDTERSLWENRIISRVAFICAGGFSGAFWWGWTTEHPRYAFASVLGLLASILVLVVLWFDRRMIQGFQESLKVIVGMEERRNS
jgi:O-antigen/teichoic acid export membrane protein